MSFRKWRFLIGAVVLLTSCNEKGKESVQSTLSQAVEVEKLPYFNSAQFTPEWEKRIHKIPGFSFTNQLGEEVTQRTFNGKIYVANFFFTVCPGICPKLTKNMGLLQKKYKNDPDILLISHSVMPWMDTVDRLSAYAMENAITLPQWHLVTGNRDSIYRMARKGYFADYEVIENTEAEDFIHTENFVLVDREGHIRGVYNGTLELEVKRLIRHIEILKKEV
ncbi:MAG: SCO family protein [Bacteroidota bacterium]